MIRQSIQRSPSIHQVEDDCSLVRLNSTTLHPRARCIVPALGCWLALLAGTAQAATQYVDTPPPGLAPGSVYHRIFVTSFDTFVTSVTTFPPSFPSFGGVRNADWLVTFAAENAGLLADWDGNDLAYRAILSDSLTNARDHFTIDGPIYNMQNQLVAASYADFWDGTLANPIKYDELGNEVAAVAQVWTGTIQIGLLGISDCLNWSVQAGSGVGGSPFLSGGGWVNKGTVSCSSSARLYGISGAITVVPEPSSWLLGLIAFTLFAFKGLHRSKRRHPPARTF